MPADREGIFADLASARSWVDPATNYTSLFGIELRHDFSSLIQGQYPLSFLPTFLHELTHHWCFQSPVGTALAMLKFATLRYALTRDTMTIDGQFDVLENLIRFESAIGVLRPISEGLSLYAEFDIRPGDQALVSQPMQWVAAFAERRTNPPDLLRTLITARLDEHTIRRKANVLVQRLDSRDGGYLPGYMFVKNLWLDVMTRCDRFVDLDFFFGYLRSYFYEDMGLVAALFDPSTVEMNSANAIIKHVQRRIQCLNDEPNLEDRVREYEEDVLMTPRIVLFGTRGAPSARQGILLTDEDAEIGAKRYLEHSGELMDSEPEELINERLKTLHRISVAQRQILCVAREKVSVKLSKSKRHVLCEQHGTLLCAIPAVDGVKDVAGEGTLAFIIFPATSKWAVSVTLDGKVVGVSSLPGLDAGENDLVLSYSTDDAAYVMQIEFVDEVLKAVIQRGGSQVLWEHFVAERDEAVNKLFTIGATIKVPEEHLVTCTESLRRQGFWELLGGELDHVNAYALLGLCTSLRLIRTSDVTKVLFDRDLDLKRLLYMLQTEKRRHHLPVIKTGQDHVLSYF